MCFNPGPERRVPIPNRYIADAKFCFCKNNKRIIIRRRIHVSYDPEVVSDLAFSSSFSSSSDERDCAAALALSCTATSWSLC